jgi:CHAT domain-containing protein
MPNHYKYLIIIIFYPIFCQSQNENIVSDSIKAVNLNRHANELGKNGLHIQALDIFFESLNIRKKLYGDKSFNLAAAYNGIGITYRSLGQLDLALKYFGYAEQNYLLNENLKSGTKVSLFLNIGNVYRSKLDYIKALQYFEQALSFFMADNESTPADIAMVNYNIAEIHYLIKNDDKALEIIKRNLEFAYTEDQILFYELLAFIYQIKGEITKSKSSYQKAIDLTVALNGKNHINVGISYLNYSVFLITNNQFSEADKTLKNAYSIINLTKPVNEIVLSDYYRTEGYLSTNKPIAAKDIDLFKKEKKQNLSDANEWFRKGLTALNFPENYTVESANASVQSLSLMDCISLLKLIADNYNELANMEQTKENLVFTESISQAIQTYQVVSSLIQRARKEISDDESKIQLTTLEYSTFNKIIQISYTAYFITKDIKYLELAFQNAERAKSSSVFDKISDQLALENSLVPDSLLQLEKKLNNTIAIFSEKLYEENSKSIPDSILTKEYNYEIFEASRQREELNRHLENEFSDFYDLKYSNSMLTANQIQQKLKNDQIIIEYVLNETDTLTELYSFVISKKNIEFSKQKMNSAFHHSIETMFYFMSNTEYMFTKNEDSRQFCLAANQLYKSLILPFKNLIQHKKITIIPDGKLSYIPFDALLVNLPDTANTIEFNQLSYLIRDYCINYSNSANLLFKQKSPDKKTSIKAIAFAPEYKDGEIIEVANRHLTLIPLPGVQKEVEEIAKVIKTKILKGDDATENYFRNNAEKYDILHLAMHAFINDSLPAFSSLAFTQIETEDPTKNGLLNTMDIYNFKLNAKLTVLSACNTGSGQLRKGEGIMSLARGFFYAGCPSIIMSLWEVEDESGTQIMTSFYKNLKKGKNKDESLRLAKLEYLESVSSRRAHPHYWLGFVSIGDNSALYLSYDYYFFILLILALSGIGIDQAIRIKKARKKRAL